MVKCFGCDAVCHVKCIAMIHEQTIPDQFLCNEYESTTHEEENIESSADEVRENEIKSSEW